MLSVSSALVADVGTYTCVAVNAGGDTQREFDLRVYGEFIHSRVCHFLCVCVLIYYCFSSMCSLSKHPLIAGEIVQQLLPQTR